MSSPANSAANWQNIASWMVRLVTFGSTMLLIGVVFLPWLRLDGINDASTGAELTALVASPMVKYLFLVSPIETAVMIVCPVLAMALAVRIAMRYAKRRTALYSTIGLLTAAIAVTVGTFKLTSAVAPDPYVGLDLILCLSALLLAHQVVIKLRRAILSPKWMPEFVGPAMCIITGSPYERWKCNLRAWRG